MQSKDFDKSIRDLLNGHTPEYNPADWDRMEDMLQNIPGGTSSSPGAEGMAGNAAKGLSALSGKAWVVAAMVGLTAVNVAVLYTANNKENSETPASEAARPVTYSADAAEAPAEEAVAFLPENASPQGPEAIQAPEPEPSAQAAFNAAVTDEGQIPAAATGTQEQTGHRAGAPNQEVPYQAAVTGNAGVAAGSAGSVIAPATAANSGLAGGGHPGTAITAPVSACEGNSKPYLPYLISGLDTVTTLSFTLTACEPFCLRLPARDNDPGDRIRMSANLLQLPGARFELSPEHDAEASFCWTPTAEQARAEAYTLRVNLQNEHCPGINPVLVQLKVSPSATVKISGDSLLMAGQQTRLRLVGLPAEATVQWLPAAGLETGLRAREVIAAPTRSTTYTAKVTTATGCALTAAHKVRVMESAAGREVFLPNIFTPNGDNLNDYFEVKGLEPGQMELTVLDRTGRTVYHNPRYDNTWNGSGLPDGLYTYVLRSLTTGKTWRKTIEISRK